MFFPTWMKCKPWLNDYPWLIVYDAASKPHKQWMDELSWFSVRHSTVVPWHFREDLDQRERMLTAWVKEVPRHIGTRYWAKIDADIVATSSAPWPLPEWFEGGPCQIVTPWGYTKPRPRLEDWGLMLDTWAETIEELADQPSLNLPRLQPGENKIRHRRTNSWCQISSTNWSYQVSQWFEGRMPVPSQDTYHWYCAARAGELIKYVKMKNHGWVNIGNDRKRKKFIEEIMGESNGCCG